jgi:hypothetical protein
LLLGLVAFSLGFSVTSLADERCGVDLQKFEGKVVKFGGFLVR